MRQQHLGGYEDYHDSPELIGEDRGDEYYRPQRRWPAGLLTVGAMVVFAGGLYFAYMQGTKHPTLTPTGDGVPLIRADERPTKVKPDQPGGMPVPDQNVSLYNDKPGGPPVEKLLAPPEQPLPRPAAPPKDAFAPPPIPGPFASAPAATPAQPPGTAASQSAPAPATTAGKPGAPVKPAPAAKQGTAKEAAAILGASTAAPKAASGPVKIQLGSVRSAEAARDEWARLKREQPDLLGKLTAVAVRADLGDKGTYYRIQAGPLADGGAAERLCSELRQRKLGCTLVR